MATLVGQRPVLPPLLIEKWEAAELLNISERYVERLIELGELPSVRIGRLVRLRVSDVEAYARSLAVARR